MEIAQSKVLGLSRNVFFLGIVSFLTDISSEMIFAVMPLFLFNVLRVGTPVIGLIEGIAEGTASLVKLGSGWLSDRLSRRKNLAVLGYGLSALIKPVLYFATAWSTVLGIRFADRVGKGIRSAPRDALIADSTTPGEMGRSFGFHRGMDTLGAVIGLSLAAAIIYSIQKGGLELSRESFQTLVLAGIGPALLAVVVLFFFVRERRRRSAPAPEPQSPATVGAVGRSGKGFDLRFKIFLGVIVLFTLGNSSDAFLVLRAQDLGLSVVEVLLLFVFFNAVYAFASLPAGLASDRLGRRGLLVTGWCVYALAYLGFALASSPWHVWLLFGVYGLYSGMVEGVSRAFVADLVPVERRGTAYGLFNAAVGLSLLPASIIAGWLWFLFSPQAPFLLGAALAAAAALVFALLVKDRGKRGELDGF
ncbi:MAG: MFS transporter [Dehalococcoidia bacterium]|nr:MFS transporter [Dehalococcoidia bacterium]